MVSTRAFHCAINLRQNVEKSAVVFNVEKVGRVNTETNNEFVTSGCTQACHKNADVKFPKHQQEEVVHESANVRTV